MEIWISHLKLEVSSSLYKIIFNKESIDNPVKLSNQTFNHLLFAVDFVILSESPTGMQNCINSLGKCCEKRSLNINTKKTKVTILSKTERETSTWNVS